VPCGTTTSGFPHLSTYASAAALMASRVSRFSLGISPRLLSRRHVHLSGGESNALEDVEAGMIHPAESVYRNAAISNRDEWTPSIRLREHYLSNSVDDARQIRLRAKVNCFTSDGFHRFPDGPIPGAETE
jgi:hypothetical protein